jgi:sugar/nucleoside kinase (ribokinase family)/fructoselysine-6-P-deglycase FrlB-like protein
MNGRTTDSEVEVFAYGKLVWDHVFKLDEARRPRFVGSAGGGSAFNTLANVARHPNVGAHAVGVAGDDRAGHAAAQQLRELGADTRLVRLQPGTRTSLIFETLEGHDLRLTGQTVVKRMGTTCVVCGQKAPDHEDPRLTEADKRALVAAIEAARDRSSSVITCFDHLTQERVGTAREARKSGALTVLDVGRLGYLRYVPATEVVAQLAAFDIVMMAQRVADSLVERAGLEGLGALARNGPAQLLLVSDGAEGLVAFDCRRRGAGASWHVSAPADSDVLDDTGAGDAVLAHVLCEIGTASARGRPVSFRAATEGAAASVRDVLRSWGARGHLGVNLMVDADQVADGGFDTDKVRRSPCAWCGQTPNTARKSRSSALASGKERSSAVAARNGSYLLLRRTLFATEQRDAVRLCADLLAGSGTAVIVGSGGSYSAASYVAGVLRRHSDVFPVAMRPREYAVSQQRTDHVVVLSYSGNTHDCGRAIRRATELDAGTIHLLTASRHPALAALLRPDDALIAYGRRMNGNDVPARERGFVSMAGTVAPSAIWAAAASDGDDFTAFIGSMREGYDRLIRRMQTAAAQLAPCLYDGVPLQVFYSIHGAAAAIDLESKFVEGNLGPVQLHEAKDFSHGRFMAVLEATPPAISLFLRTHPSGRYEDALHKVLMRDTTLVTVDVKSGGILGGLELLVAVQVLARECGRLAGKDISRPHHIPRDGLKLYRWGDALD